MHQDEVRDQCYWGQNKLASLSLWLDLKCPPEALVLKVWSSACSAIGRRWNLQEVGPSRRKVGHGGVYFAAWLI